MMMRKPAPVLGIAAGIAAGLVASLVMDGFQKLWAKALPSPSTDDAATVKAAQKASRIATGTYFAKQDKAAAGQWVHYLFGAGLGGAYGLLAEYRPGVTRGFGTAFGAGSALLFDEVGVPAAGLSDPPYEAPLAAHAYAIGSHLAFGSVTEGIRRVLRA